MYLSPLLLKGSLWFSQLSLASDRCEARTSSDTTPALMMSLWSTGVTSAHHDSQFVTITMTLFTYNFSHQQPLVAVHWARNYLIYRLMPGAPRHPDHTLATLLYVVDIIATLSVTLTPTFPPK